ncbi:hypothetical protein [Leptolyngbya sp. KIOST-1]|uniref:hypothetical protein n=1 Tax=Leptolyngbya sp. KIOST-1 TaxID=1229172 RepID=UPI00056C6510|nr:hypothetical protein [Leptolyngbya sp. KIOST-1]
MTTPQKSLSVRIKTMLRAWPQAFEAIAAAAGRLFSPSHDDYPKTGVQPFSGDVPEDHSGQHSP